MRKESQANAVARAVLAAAEASASPLEVALDASGLELHACAPIADSLPNRARLRVLALRPSYTLVFFYKRSLVPFSHDRYSYGGIELRNSEFDESGPESWLDFVNSGFHPDHRPANLRRAFPFEIPE